MRDLIERLTAILHDPDLATRMATPRLREAVATGELTPIEAIQWVGKEYRYVVGGQFFTFAKTAEDTWAIVGDERRYATTWPITVRGVFAELARVVSRRNLGMLLLLSTGLGAGITAAEWAHLLVKLTPARPPANPWLALPVAAVPVVPPTAQPTSLPTPTPLPQKASRRRVAIAAQPALFGEVA